MQRMKKKFRLIDKTMKKLNKFLPQINISITILINCECFISQVGLAYSIPSKTYLQMSQFMVVLWQQRSADDNSSAQNRFVYSRTNPSTVYTKIKFTLDAVIYTLLQATIYVLSKLNVFNTHLLICINQFEHVWTARCRKGSEGKWGAMVGEPLDSHTDNSGGLN